MTSTADQPPLLEVALAYVVREWPVFPCSPQAKEPIGTLAPNGVHSASADPETVTEWWQEQPQANHHKK